MNADDVVGADERRANGDTNEAGIARMEVGVIRAEAGGQKK